MNTELRPMRLGEILDRTAQLYRSNFLLFVGINIFPTSVLLALGLGTVVVGRFMNKGFGSLTAAKIIAVLGVAFVGALVYVVLVGLSLAANNRAVSDLYLDQPASIGRAYSQVRPHWFRYIWVMFVAALYAWAPVFLIYLAFIAALAGASRAFRMDPAAIGVLSIIAVIAILAAIPFGIWMTLRYALAVPASIFEDLRAHASLKRSVFLTRNGRGRIFVLLLLVAVISVVLSLAVQVPFMIVDAIAARAHHEPPLLAAIGAQVGSFLVGSLLGPVYGIAITLFYYDERIRKEGFDIDWMMRRANLTGLEPPPVPLGPAEPATE